ncbi:unnamed protein product [Anisakis simplex]|uniref:TRP_2 domain-containing protein n=1 Tax=Anisakis simplex TaxID=6269 RepID=A0A0M3K0X8_ANISI|nr:unnamed protein product [Anisakis simplex]
MSKLLGDSVDDEQCSYQVPSKVGRYAGRVEWKKEDRVGPLLRNFRFAVVNRDYDSVKKIFSSFGCDMHVEQSDRLTELVLDRYTAEPTKEALMTAICIGSRPLVEFILSLFYEFPSEERTGCRYSSAFPPHMTPLMLASVCNNFAIVQCLLLRGVCVTCKQCTRSLTKGLVTLDTYRAMTSEAFLWLACCDPLYASFELATDLEVAYQQLHQKVMFFAVQFIERCWDMKEVDLLLSRNEDEHVSLVDDPLRLPRLPIETILHLYVYVYALGMALRHYLDLYTRGMASFYEMWWVWFDLILLLLFSGACFCKVMTWAVYRQDGLMKLHRKHWVFYDFSMMYDICFGSACILAFWRIFYYVQLRRILGSTVVRISIACCVADVVSFLTIMAVVMWCFSIGISCIYEPYLGNKVINIDGTHSVMQNTYNGILKTLRQLYWSFYGYLAPWDYTLIVGNVGPNAERAQHVFTVIAGEVIVAIFHITVVVTLLNLMVTILVKRADEVQEGGGGNDDVSDHQNGEWSTRA